MALACTLLAASIVPFVFRKNIRNANGILIPPGPLLRYAFLRKYPERALSGWAIILHLDGEPTLCRDIRSKNRP
jgi:hypothetical protein